MILPPPELAPPPPLVLYAEVETQPVDSLDDAADDPAIWVHPTHPERSLVLGTDKKAGLVVYDLTGKRVSFIADGRLNNVDIRDGFKMADGAVVSIAAATQRDEKAIVLYSIAVAEDTTDPTRGSIVKRIPGSIPTGLKEPYGVALYHSPVNGEYYVFATDKDGAAQQFRLIAAGEGRITGTLVREFQVGSIAEGMVADDRHRCLYVSEEQVAVWKYPAEPGDESPRMAIDLPRPRGHFTPDAEGIAILATSADDGYLVLSSQGDNSFSVFTRLPPHEYVLSFTIGDGANGIDGVSETDGIEIMAAPLGPKFPKGMIAVQDGENGADAQNFKLISAGPLIDALAALNPIRRAP